MQDLLPVTADSYGDVKRVPAAPRYPLRVRVH